MRRVEERFKREGPYVYLQLIYVDGRNQHNIAKQLYFNFKKKKLMVGKVVEEVRQMGGKS